MFRLMFLVAYLNLGVLAGCARTPTVWLPAEQVKPFVGKWSGISSGERALVTLEVGEDGRIVFQYGGWSLSPVITAKVSDGALVLTWTGEGMSSKSIFRPGSGGRKLEWEYTGRRGAQVASLEGGHK